MSPHALQTVLSATPEPADLPRRDGHASTTSVPQQVTDAMPDAVLRLDPEGRIVYANRLARKLGRIQPENLNRERAWELYPQLAGTEVDRAYHEAVSSGQAQQVDEFHYQPLDAWLEVAILPMERGVVAHIRDITSVKETEAARDELAERLQQVLDTTNDSVMTVDRDWRINYMNRSARELLAPSGDVLGTKLWESFPAATRKDTPYMDTHTRAMNDGIAGEFESYYPEPLNLWVSVRVCPSRDGIIVFFKDVTRQKQAAEALMEAEKLAAVGRLASSIAHEINNPLEAVTNLIYLARDQAVLPETRQYLDLADKELRRISIIANQTLRFHKQSTHPQAINCAELFSTVLSIYQGKLKNSNIKVEKRKRAHQSVVCFEGEIRQVLSNFVGNAIDAMPSGGRLLVRSREATDWRTGRKGLVLTVADTGSGIDPRIKSKIFEAFFTTKGMAGNGLGLWVSAEIVKRHGARLRIRSSQRNPHTGTVAALFLPFQPVARDRIAAPSL